MRVSTDFAFYVLSGRCPCRHGSLGFTIADEIITGRHFSVLGILLVIQAAAEITAKIYFACTSMCMWFRTCGARRGGNRALEHSSTTTMSHGILSPFFGSWFSDLNGVKQRETERPDVEAPEKCPCRAAVAGLWIVPRLFGDDTHAVARPKWHESTGYTRSVVQFVGGLWAWPVDMW